MQVNYETWDLSLKDWLFLAISALVCGMAVGWLFYDSGKVGICLAVIALPILKEKYVGWRIEKRQKGLRLQFRDLLYSIASSISVGRSMGQALEESLTFWKDTYSEKEDIMLEAASMVRQIKEGNTGDLDVLYDFAARSGLTEVTDFVLVYECCKTSGANLIQAIDRAAAMIGDRINLERELQTLMAQKRFEGRIVMTAPFLIVFFIKIVSPGYLAPLTASAEGYLITSLVLILILVAWMLTERVNHLEF